MLLNRFVERVHDESHLCNRFRRACLRSSRRHNPLAKHRRRWGLTVRQRYKSLMGERRDSKLLSRSVVSFVHMCSSTHEPSPLVWIQSASDVGATSMTILPDYAFLRGEQTPLINGTDASRPPAKQKQSVESRGACAACQQDVLVSQVKSKFWKRMYVLARACMRARTRAYTHTRGLRIRR